MVKSFKRDINPGLVSCLGGDGIVDAIPIASARCKCWD